MDKDALIAIGRPNKICMNCNQSLDAVERHPSVLKTGAKTPERMDFCPECWKQIKEEAFDSFWITRRAPKQTVIRMTRKERSCALRALFESLWERRETEDVGPHLFLLAHLLMKWGGLKFRESRKDDETGRETIVFEDPASGDPIALDSIQLDDERILAIKTEIEEFLRSYAPEDEVAL